MTGQTQTPVLTSVDLNCFDSITGPQAFLSLVSTSDDSLTIGEVWSREFSAAFGAICYFWRSSWDVDASSRRVLLALRRARGPARHVIYLRGRGGRKLNGDRCCVGGALGRSARSACGCMQFQGPCKRRLGRRTNRTECQSLETRSQNA